MKAVTSISNKRKIALQTKFKLLKPNKSKSSFNKTKFKRKMQLGIRNYKSDKIDGILGNTIIKPKRSFSISTPDIKRESHIEENKNEGQNEKPLNLGSLRFINSQNHSSLNQTKLNSNTRKSGKRKNEASKLSYKRTVEKQDILPPRKFKLNLNKVESAVSSLLKICKKHSNDNSELLDLSDPILLQVECVKIPICATKQLRFKLPHPLVSELSDILLITADKKGTKIYPEKAVEHYVELLQKHNVNFIQKVIPVRSLRDEYYQYEMRRKLVDQFDIILADANIIKLLPGLLGNFICYKRKMPVPVHLDRLHLKEHLQRAITTTQMTVKANGHVSVLQVGNSKMSAREVATNIIEVGIGLVQKFPGGWRNIRCMNIKTPSSTALPVYLSLVSPNTVRIPVKQHNKKVSVEDELSTMPGMNVIVRSDGTVFLKKVSEEKLTEQDSVDDDILREAEKYIQSSKTVHYGESDGDDNSDKEGDAITAAAEHEFLTKYDRSMKSNKFEADEDEEEEESSDEDGEDSPLPRKKPKEKITKKEVELTEKSTNNNKKKSQVHQNLKTSSKTPQGGVTAALQRRGSRGGKRNKMSKDQRKAIIKRKKAGKS